MKKTLSGSAAAMAAAVILSVAAFLNAGTARAQITVTNNTGCIFHLCLYNAAGTVICYAVPSNATPVILPYPATFNPIGAVSNAGTNMPFAPAPPAIGCTACFTQVVPPPGGPALCCATVCYDPGLATITINACPPPCAP